MLGFTPDEIANRQTGLAQALYEGGFTSYPGTDSEKYPADWDDSDVSQFVELLEGILHTELNDCPPTIGKKDDPAHPCIMPVAFPNADTLSANERALFDLIARRCACGFGNDAIDATKNIHTTIGKHRFSLVGKTCKDKGWRDIYPFTDRKDRDVPNIDDGITGNIKGTRQEKKLTKPPSPYNVTSLIAKCEKYGLGTKNTRPGIIDKMVGRKYLATTRTGKKTVLHPFETAISVVEILDRYADIASGQELTDMFNKNMLAIEKDDSKAEKMFYKVNKSMFENLESLLKSFKQNEKKIREEISGYKAFEIACPVCKGELLLKKSRSGKYFYGCSNYPDCSNSYFINPGEELRETLRCGCGLPLVSGKSDKNEYIRCIGDCDDTPLRCGKCGDGSTAGISKNGKPYVLCRKCRNFKFDIDLDRIEKV